MSARLYSTEQQQHRIAIAELVIGISMLASWFLPWYSILFHAPEENVYVSPYQVATAVPHYLINWITWLLLLIGAAFIILAGVRWLTHKPWMNIINTWLTIMAILTLCGVLNLMGVFSPGTEYDGVSLNIGIVIYGSALVGSIIVTTMAWLQKGQRAETA